jgi:hypothetical protein
MSACAKLTYNNVSRTAFDRMKKVAESQYHVIVHDDSGCATQSGFTVCWKYIENSQTFSIQCTDSPFFAPCSIINSTINDVVAPVLNDTTKYDDNTLVRKQTMGKLGYPSLKSPEKQKSVSLYYQEKGNDMSANQNIQDGPLAVLEKRQKTTLDKMSPFVYTTILIAAGGFTLIFLAKLAKDLFSNNIPTISFSLGDVISLILTLFANIIIWLFVIWSLSAIPYISYQSFKSSQMIPSSMITKPFKWVQLSAATFLPMIIFAVAWISFAANENIDIITKINLNELAFVFAGAVLIVLILVLVNHLVPASHAEIRLNIISFILYLSLFLTYGWGYSPVSYSMVFGILFYFAFGGGTNSMGEMLRRIAIYDVDAKVADKLEDILKRHQDLRVVEDEARLREQEFLAQKEENRQKEKITQLVSDDQLNQQLSHVREKKIELNQKVNEAEIAILDKKILLLGQMFDILSSELNQRMASKIQDHIKSLSANAKGLSPVELNVQMNQLIAQMDQSLEGIPESLEDLRTQLLVTAKAIEDQTLLLVVETKKPENTEKDS